MQPCADPNPSSLNRSCWACRGYDVAERLSRAEILIDALGAVLRPACRRGHGDLHGTFTTRRHGFNRGFRLDREAARRPGTEVDARGAVQVRAGDHDVRATRRGSL